MEKEQKHYPPRAVLEDGTEIRLVPLNLTGGKPLYVSKDGQGYSYVREKFRAIKDYARRAHHRRDNWGDRFFRHHNKLNVSRAVLEAWVGPRPEGMECDHINGNPRDNRLCNLEWVTHAENVRRRWIANTKEGKGFNGKRLTELGKRTLRRRRKYAREHGISLVELVIQFNEN